jgi:PAT family beta-lactamase induction signal transducer AmpG
VSDTAASPPSPDSGVPESGAPPEPPKRGMLGALGVFADRRIAVMLGLGFAAGLPNFLMGDTMSAWMRAAGLSLTAISLFSLATLPYSFKFLWAPLVDRTEIPLLTGWLGHRRSWMVVTQVAIIIGLSLVAISDPAKGLGALAVFAVLTVFASATQDIVIDAWRIEAAEVSRQGAMAASYQWGYRIATVAAGALALVIGQHVNWHAAYAAMVLFMALGLAAAVFAPPEREHVIRPIPTGGIPPAPALELVEWSLRLALLVVAALLIGSGLCARADLIAGAARLAGANDAAAFLQKAWTAKPNGVWLQLASVVVGFAVVVLAAWPLPGVKTRPGVDLFHALGDPLVEFFRRFGRQALLILALICLYRLSDFVLNIMNAFYQDLGFTLTQIAEVRKVFGLGASLVGVFIGGLSVARLGVMRSLVIGAVALPITNTIFGWLAVQGPGLSPLFVAIGVDNIVSAYATTCLIAYMSSLTSAGFTATQYALFSSLYALPGKVIASQSGRIVESAAQAAEPGGPLAPLRALFVHTPPDAFSSALSKSHVDPISLGAGYVVFFLYSGAVGVAAMVLAVLVARQRPRPETPETEGAAAP